MLKKTYQKESKLFEFLRELKIRKNDVTLHLLRWNGFIAMIFASTILLCLQTKLSSFLKTGHATKNQSDVKDFKANENAALPVRTFL